MLKVWFSQIFISIFFSCLILPATCQAQDQVFLKNGTVLQGEIVDPGRNYIELKTALGSTKIRKRDIERITLGKVQTETVLDVDRLILRNGRVVKGDVTVSADGKFVTIRIPGKGSATYPRREVVKIVPRGEPWGERPAGSPEELDKLVEDLVQKIEAGGSPAKRAQEELKSLGILALPKLKEVLPEETGKAKSAIERIIRSYELRKIVGDTLDEELPELYDQLESPDEEKRIDALKAALMTEPEEAVKLFVFKLRDPEESHRVRAFCVEMLRRLNRYKELISLYEESEGALAFALAVALAENGVSIGIPAFIAALTDENDKLKAVAVEKLKDLTGLDFFPPPSSAPEKWKEAASKYRAWWEQNKGKIQSQIQALLAKKPASTPQRARAVAKWREGDLHWRQGRLLLAERSFREAVEIDPTFARAALCLGVVLSRREKAAEAEKVLLRVVEGRFPDITPELQARAAYELAGVYRKQGNWIKAVKWYRWATIAYPNYFEAYLAMGDTLREAALRPGGLALDVEKKRRMLNSACEALRKGFEALTKYDNELVVLPMEGAAPLGQGLPIGRRSYLKSVKTLKAYLTRLKSQFGLTLGKVYLTLGQTDKAEAVLKEAASGDPNNLTIQLLLGLVFDREGKKEQALRQYRRVLRLDPNNPVARQGKKRLADLEEQ